MKTTGKKKSERRSISRVAASAALALPLCGCLLGPDWSEPTPPTSIPERFRGAGSNDAAESSGAAEARIPADEALFQADAESGTPAPHDAATAGESWWMRWDDPVLRRLLAEGYATNLTLAQAAERTIQAREAVEAARAALLPTLGASGAATRTRSFDPGRTDKSWRAGADAAWEIDLFGGARRTAEAAAAELEGAGWSERDALLSLRAEIVSAYATLRLAQTSLAIARDNLAAERDNAEIARAKGRSGFTSGSDVAAAEAAIATAEAGIPSREAAADAAARALELLLARAPDELEELLAAPDPAAPPPPPVAPEPPGAAPPQVLAQRPDVRRAAAALHAATARIGAAKAARWPSIDLAAGLTLSAQGATSWSDAVKSLAFGPSLNVPVFRGGALAAAERRADSVAREALLAWHEAVLSAIHEAQVAWTQLNAERARGPALERAIARDEEALEAARERYRAGSGDWTDVLVRQTALLAARLSLAQHRADLATLTVALAKALGAE